MKDLVKKEAKIEKLKDLMADKAMIQRQPYYQVERIQGRLTCENVLILFKVWYQKILNEKCLA